VTRSIMVYWCGCLMLIRLTIAGSQGWLQTVQCTHKYLSHQAVSSNWSKGSDNAVQLGYWCCTWHDSSVRITWKSDYARPPHLFSLPHRAHAVAKNLGTEGPHTYFSVIRWLHDSVVDSRLEWRLAVWLTYHISQLLTTRAAEINDSFID